jgi:putative iron-dependent peroxidase
MATPQSAILPEAGSNGLFLTLHLQRHGTTALDQVRGAAVALPSLTAEIAAIDQGAGVVAALAFGMELWDALGKEMPSGMHAFEPLGEGGLSAPATHGDLFLHVHSTREDLNFLLAKRIVSMLKGVVEGSDEVHGFQYLDCRDLTGFIDGTENPEGKEERAKTALIKEAPFAGGSFVITQRYIHELDRWEGLDDREQESIVGRTKPDSVELDDAVRPATAHISRVVIEEEGEELEIVRHSLPYGAASGEFGLIFVAYSRELATFDKMLQRMYGSSGDGLHDRLMEFSRPVTGAYFFAPSLELLAKL